ncbi:UNVERIFIED_CONTAM: hypothetical protein K2H54_029758, partial [Gekko kuhli]
MVTCQKGELLPWTLTSWPEGDTLMPEFTSLFNYILIKSVASPADNFEPKTSEVKTTEKN